MTPAARSRAMPPIRRSAEPCAETRLHDLLARSPALRRLVRTVRPPSHLYHYTSAETLPRILDGAPFDAHRRADGDPPDGTPLPRMRATHLRFMNDRSELKLATDLISAELARHAARRRGATAARLDAVRDALDALSDEPWIWAVSWSERGNQLSQWRAYAGGVGGYSVGVPAAHLLRMAAWQRFVLMPCVYRADLQRRIAAELVDRFVVDVARRDAGEARCFAEDLLFLGATFKHHGFEEEREWRLILRAPRDAAAPAPQIGFAPTPYGLASWVPFWLRAGSNDRLRGLRIVVGPDHDVDAIVLSTRVLLDRTVGVDGVVEASGIPLRR